MSKRCCDVVESRVEQAILDAESRMNAALTPDSEQPRRASPSGRRADLTMTRCAEPVLPIVELAELSNRQREKSEPARLWRISATRRPAIPCRRHCGSVKTFTIVP
jgi:hypothetical protein